MLEGFHQTQENRHKYTGVGILILGCRTTELPTEEQCNH